MDQRGTVPAVNADYSGGVGDLATPETFPIRATFGRWMKALSPLFVLLFLVSVFLFTGVALMVLFFLDREHGLVGAGLLTANPQAPASVKTQVERFLASSPVDPEIGQRPMGIPLMRFDEGLDWQNGRIGQWVRANRPDLLASPPIL